MSKAYPSNLTCAQYELVSDLIPEPKRGGRPRSGNIWEVLKAIFYVLVEGVRWPGLPGDFPPWQTVYTGWTSTIICESERESILKFVGGNYR